MSNFIDTSDYNASIHREILSSLLRQESAGGHANPDYDPQVVEICEDRAVAEMRSYLSKTYDCDAIFSTRGADRHSLILMFAIDISLYHIFSIHNPMKMPRHREERYNRAIEWLKQVASRDVTIDGAPRLPQENQNDNSPWQIHADTVRPTLI